MRKEEGRGRKGKVKMEKGKKEWKERGINFGKGKGKKRTKGKIYYRIAKNLLKTLFKLVILHFKLLIIKCCFSNLVNQR